MIKEVRESTHGEELYRFSPPVVVILHKRWDQIAEAERVLLGRILAAIKQSLASVRIIHSSQLNPLSFPAGSKIITFGIKTDGIAPYQLANLGELTMVSADPLDALDDIKKKDLWAALKQF